MIEKVGGPGEIRTHDLFHAMEEISIAYRQSGVKTKDLARGEVDPGGRHGRTFRRLGSMPTPGLQPRTGAWRAFARGCRLL